jgi:hypothetical protein
VRLIAGTDDPALVHDLLVVALPATIAAVAAILAAFIASAARRDAGRARKSAADAKEYANTGNGMTLGETAHDTNQTVELLAAMLHTNTKETILLQERMNSQEALLAEHVAEASGVHARIADYLDRQESIEEKEGTDG